MIYLYKDGMFTGETFRSFDEVHDWYKELMGHSPDDLVAFLMSHGRHWQVGSGYFHCLIEDVVEMARAA